MENENGCRNIFKDIKEKKEILINVSSRIIRFTYCWLRDNCRCSECYDLKTNQRSKHIAELPEDLSVKSCMNKDNNIEIIWHDEHRTLYDEDFLEVSHYEGWVKGKMIERILWRGKSVPTDIAFVDRDKFLSCEKTLKKFLKSLVTYGVAFVDNVKPSIEDTELVIRRVAPPQNTLFGGMWKFTSDLNRADTAYTNIPLAPHNDGTYMTVSPGLQVLHCLEHNGKGGDTIAVDGFFAAHALQGARPDLYNVLCEEMQPAKYEEEGWHLYHCDRVIKKDPLTGQSEQIRYNVYDRTQHCVSTEPSKVVRMNEALKEFGRICDLDSVKWLFKLNPGRVFFFDNWRILHGRTGFTGRRVLGGAYVSRDDWMSAARVRGLIQ